MSIHSIRIENFAHIAKLDLTFGDLTIIVGEQATGKSLAMQWVKLLSDKHAIRGDFKKYGFEYDDVQEFYELYFGEGYQNSFHENLAIKFRGRDIEYKDIHASRLPTNSNHTIRLIPAHRGLLMADGWPKLFQQHSMDTPYVARRCSEDLFNQLNSNRKESKKSVFPRPNKLKAAVRDLIDRSVYHGSRLTLEKSNQKKRLEIITSENHGGSGIPFLGWTAGQREFTPLLISLYDLMPAGNVQKDPNIDTVIIEEPEMGLHAEAIHAVIVLISELLHRGYKVIITTHCTNFLDFAWGINELKDMSASAHDVCKAFEFPTALKHVAGSILQKKVRVYNFAFNESGKVESHDISSLNPIATNPQEASWGGLTKFTSKMANSICELASARNNDDSPVSDVDNSEG